MPDSAIHAVPGLKDVAHDDAARTFFIRGQFNDDVNGVLPLETPEVAEYKRYYCSNPEDVTGVGAPVYLYYGDADGLYLGGHADYWADEFENIAKVRIYEGEGHDVQYRHWDQILIDMAGMGDKTIICHNGKSKLLPERTAEKFIARGATLGICAWEQGEYHFNKSSMIQMSPLKWGAFYLNHIRCNVSIEEDLYRLDRAF